MKIKTIQSKQTFIFDSDLNEFLEKNKNVIQILFNISDSCITAIISYYTDEEMQLLKINKLLEPKLIINK